MGTIITGAVLHHVLAFVMFGCILFQHLVFERRMGAVLARKLRIVDVVYGTAAVFLLLVGLARAFVLEKTPDYYLSNGFFHMKLTFFIVAALISLYPTVQYLRSRNAGGEVFDFGETVAKRIRWIHRIQIVLILGVIVCAALIARGVGSN